MNYKAKHGLFYAKHAADTQMFLYQEKYTNVVEAQYYNAIEGLIELGVPMEVIEPRPYAVAEGRR